MKFHLREFHDRKVIELNFEESPNGFDFDNDEIYRFKSAIKFTGKAEKVYSKILVRGVIETRITASCSRCLEEFSFDFSHDFSFLYLKKKGNREIDESQEAYYHSEEIDLNPEIRDFIILNLPTKPLCSSDCKGICLDCGENLNHGKCKCTNKKKKVNKLPEAKGEVNLGKIIKQTLQGGN